MKFRLSHFFVCTAALSACGGGETFNVPIEDAVVDVFDGHSAHVWSGVVDLTDPAQAAMAGRGWALPKGLQARPQWIWSNAPESAVWIASAQGAVPDSSLILEVRAPGFAPHGFSIRVELNHMDLGVVPLDPDSERVKLSLPKDFELLPMNRLVLRGSLWESPESLGVGEDTRRLSFNFRSARLASPDEELLVRRIRPARGAYLDALAGLEFRVFDLDASALIAQRGSRASGRMPIQPAVLGDELAIILRLSTDSGAPRVEPEVTMGVEPGNLSVVLIVIDTLRADAVGLVSTPNIDRLIREGVQFENAFANAPMTLPSHTAIFSSRLPSTSGVVNNGQNVPAELPLLPDLLRSQGYATLGVVSIGTLWFAAPGASLDRGFGQYLTAGPLIPDGFETAELLANRVQAGALDGPFMLFAHFADPHVPYRSREPGPELVALELDGEVLWTFAPSASELFVGQLDLSKGEHKLSWSSPLVDAGLLDLRLSVAGTPLEFRIVKGGLREFGADLDVRFTLGEAATVDCRVWPADHPVGQERILRYAGEVMRADAALGKLIDQLERAGVWDTSLVVFTSDHGEAFAEHGYNGHVEHLYDEMLHVPLVIRPPLASDWDGVRERLEALHNRVFPLNALAPTVLDLLGRGPLRESEGRSIFEAGRDQGLLFAETHTPEANSNLYCVRDASWKLIYNADRGSFELFDLEADPGERVDVYATRAGEFASWSEQLRERSAHWIRGRERGVDVHSSWRADLSALGY